MRNVLFVLVLLSGGFILSGAVAGPVYVSGRLGVAGSQFVPGDATISLHRAGDYAHVLVTIPLSNGSYTLRAPGPGRYGIEVWADKFLPIRQWVDVPPAGVSHLVLQLTQPHSIHILLTDGLPVMDGNAQAWLSFVTKDDETGFFASALADPMEDRGVMLDYPATQKAEISPDPIQDYGPEIPVPEGVPAEEIDRIKELRIEVRTSTGCASVDLDRWPSKIINVDLSPGLHISGTVYGADGKPDANASVTAHRLFRPGWILPDAKNTGAITDSHGHFTIPSLFPEPYRLLINGLNGKERVRDVIPVAYEENLFFGMGDPAATAEDDGTGGDVGVSSMIERLQPERAHTMPIVEGRLVEWETGKPISRASVMLFPTPWQPEVEDFGWSDSDGRFRVAAPRTGSYRLQIDEPGHYRVNSDVELKDRATRENIRLVKARSVGVVVQSVDGRPIPSGSVTYGMSFGPLAEWVFKGNATPVRDGGTAALPTPTSLQVRNPTDLSKIGIAVRSGTLGCARTYQDAWPTAPIVVRLEPGATVHGRIVDPAGKPARSASVDLAAQTDKADLVCGATVQTDEDGKFTIPHLLPGTYDFFAGDSNQNDFQTVVTIAPGQEDMAVDIHLTPAVIVPFTFSLAHR